MSRDAVGLLPPDATGFRRDLWGPATADEVRRAILAFDQDAQTEALNLFRRILLAETDPPAGEAGGETVLLARIDRLLGLGALEEAGALIVRAGPRSPEMFRRWFDTELLAGDAREPCAALRLDPALSPTLPARVFCLARGGDWNAAEITLTLGRDLGSIAPEQEALIARFLDPELFEGEPDPPVPDPLTPIDFLMREAVALPRPGTDLPLAFLHRDLEDYVPAPVRIRAAERLVRAGSLAPAILFDIYRASPEAEDDPTLLRAAAIRKLDAVLAGPDRTDMAGSLSVADNLLSEQGLRTALAEEYAPLLARTHTADLTAEQTATLFELLLLAGLDATPRTDEQALLAAIATGAELPSGTAQTPLADVAAALSGQGENSEEAARLARILGEGRQGEALLQALALAREASENDPEPLREAVAVLVLAGQEDSARRIAVQTLLGSPQ